MSNLRIRDLFSTSTLPVDAVVPLDAPGLSDAQKITPRNLVEAVSYTLTPVLSSDPAPTTPEANRVSLETELAKYAASGNKRGTMRLPKGVYEVDYTVTLTCAHSGLTIEGDGCVLFRSTGASFPDRPENSVININLSTKLDPMGRGDTFSLGGNPNQFILSVTEERYANYQVGDAIILYKSTNPGGVRQPVQQVAIITAKSTVGQTITVDANLLAGVNLATYLFNGLKVVPGGLPAGATVIKVPRPTKLEILPKQSWIYVTDGVGELETVGEFVQ